LPPRGTTDTHRRGLEPAIHRARSWAHRRSFGCPRYVLIFQPQVFLVKIEVGGSSPNYIDISSTSALETQLRMLQRPDVGMVPRGRDSLQRACRTDASMHATAVQRAPPAPRPLRADLPIIVPEALRTQRRPSLAEEAQPCEPSTRAWHCMGSRTPSPSWAAEPTPPGMLLVPSGRVRSSRGASSSGRGAAAAPAEVQAPCQAEAGHSLTREEEAACCHILQVGGQWYVVHTAVRMHAQHTSTTHTVTDGTHTITHTKGWYTDTHVSPGRPPPA
jgi:hypothetical protein